MKGPFVTIRGYTKEGYHKDIAKICPSQIIMINRGIIEAHDESLMDGVSVCVHPKNFPEMVCFDVIVERE